MSEDTASDLKKGEKLSGRRITLVILGIVITLGGLVFGIVKLGKQTSAASIGVSGGICGEGAWGTGIILLAALGGLMLLLAIISGLYRLFGLTNVGEAMGLPSGTVRAFIAILAIGLFAILSLAFFQNLACASHAVDVSGLTNDEKERLVKDIPSDQLLGVVTVPAEKGETVTYTVKRLVGATRSAETFATTAMATLSTLMTAISTFYFATRSAESAQARASQQIADSASQLAGRNQTNPQARPQLPIEPPVQPQPTSVPPVNPV